MGTAAGAGHPSSKPGQSLSLRSPAVGKAGSGWQLALPGGQKSTQASPMASRYQTSVIWPRRCSVPSLRSTYKCVRCVGSLAVALSGARSIFLSARSAN